MATINLEREAAKMMMMVNSVESFVFAFVSVFSGE